MRIGAHPCLRMCQVADVITELKLGNGTSVLIFANIASALPSSVGGALSQVCFTRGTGPTVPHHLFTLCGVPSCGTASFKALSPVGCVYNAGLTSPTAHMLAHGHALLL